VGYIYSANAGLIAAVFHGGDPPPRLSFERALLMNHSTFDSSCFALCPAVVIDAVEEVALTLNLRGAGNG
jgi:hypothetical protein